MMKSIVWLTRIDRICGQLNAGLTAVAVALSILLAIQLTVRAAIVLSDAHLLDNHSNEMMLVN